MESERSSTRRLAVCRGWRIAVCFVLSAVVLSAAVVAGGGDEFADTVDIEVAARMKVNGTLRPVEERETFRVDLPFGSSVKAVAKRRGKTGTVPRLDLTNAVGDLVASGEESAKSSKLSYESMTLEDSDARHRLRLFGDGVEDGDYKLKVTVKGPRSFRLDDGVPLGPGEERTFEFGALRESGCTLQLTPGKDSPFVPRLVDLQGPNESLIEFEPPPGAKVQHRPPRLNLQRTGNYRVRLRNDGAVAGTFVLDVRLRPRRLPKSSLSIADGDLLGDFEGEQTVIGRIVDQDGALLATTPDEEDAVSQLSLQIPPGALDRPVVIIVAEGEPFFVDDDNFEAGPTLELGPSGTEFDPSAQMTIPFDPDSFDDVENELRIAVENSDGEVEQIPPPYQFDFENSRVTFAVGHFSSFQSTTPRARPLKGRFVEVEMFGRLGTTLGKAVGFGLGNVQANRGSRTGNSISRTYRRRLALWHQGAKGLVRRLHVDDGTESGTVDVESDESIAVDYDTSMERYRRGRSPHVLLREPGDETGGQFSMLLRRTLGEPSRGNLAGFWRAFVWEAGFRDSSTGGDFRVQLTSQSFVLHIGSAGVARASAAGRFVSSTEFPGSGWVDDVDGKKPPNGRLDPNGPTATLEMALGTSDLVQTVELIPTVRGDVLVGMADGFEGDEARPTTAVTRLVILMRASVNAGPEILNGRSIFRGIALFPRDVVGTPGSVLDTASVSLGIGHDGVSGLSFSGFRTVFAEGGLGGMITETLQPLEGVGTYKVKKGGGYIETAPFLGGAVTRHRAFYLSQVAQPGRFGLGIGLRARPQLSESAKPR